MRKLKLESLIVESFETAAATSSARGTVAAHARPTTLETYNVERCGDTRYFDCTLGCSVETNCFCVVTDIDCA